jgi:hypothetical protein
VYNIWLLAVHKIDGMMRKPIEKIAACDFITLTAIQKNNDCLI